MKNMFIKKMTPYHRAHAPTSAPVWANQYFRWHRRIAATAVLIALTLFHLPLPMAHASKQVHGKPQPPVSIDVAFGDGNLVREKNGALTFRINPQAPCSHLVTSIRGLDGVEITGQAVKAHESCQSSIGLGHAIHYKTLAGKAGYVVLDVRFESGSQIYSAQKIIAVGEPASRFNKKSFGQRLTDASGRKFIIMPSKQLGGP